MNTLNYDWQLTAEHPVMAQYSRHNPGVSECPADMHSAIHIGILIQGDTISFQNGETVCVSEGKIYLTSPWEQHKSIYSEKGNFLLLLTITPEVLDHALLAGAKKINTLFTIPPTERQNILNNLDLPPELPQKIIDLLSLPESEKRELQIWHAALGILIEIAALEFSAVPDSDYSRLLPSLQHLSNTPLSVAQAAQFCNLSESRFAHLFRRVFGMSFAHYERLYRLRCAVSEMEMHKTGLKEAAENWGFYDKSHFSKACKKYLKNNFNT